MEWQNQKDLLNIILLYNVTSKKSNISGNDTYKKKKRIVNNFSLFFDKMAYLVFKV